MSWINLSTLESCTTALNTTQMNMEETRTQSRRRGYSDAADEDFQEENSYKVFRPVMWELTFKIFNIRVAIGGIFRWSWSCRIGPLCGYLSLLEDTMTVIISGDKSRNLFFMLPTFSIFDFRLTIWNKQILARDMLLEKGFNHCIHFN